MRTAQLGWGWAAQAERGLRGRMYELWVGWGSVGGAVSLRRCVDTWEARTYITEARHSVSRRRYYMRWIGTEV